MNTNTQNLEAARNYWHREALCAHTMVRWVVATASGIHAVGADNTSVMLGGTTRHREFYRFHEAKDVAEKLNAQPWDFDGEKLLVMPYEHFASIHHLRFDIALRTAKAADEFAASRKVAA